MTAPQRRACRLPYVTLLLLLNLDTRQQQAALKRWLERPPEQSGRKGFPCLPAVASYPDSGAKVIPERRRPSIGWCPPTAASSHTAAPGAISSTPFALALPRVSEGMIESNNGELELPSAPPPSIPSLFRLHSLPAPDSGLRHTFLFSHLSPSKKSVGECVRVKGSSAGGGVEADSHYSVPSQRAERAAAH